MPFESFCPSTRHGRHRRETASAVWPFQVEAICFHLELRPGEWTFLLPPSVPGERSGPEPSNHCLPGFPPGTVVAVGGLPVRLLSSGFPPGTVLAAGGLPVPFGRSRWKQIASTWNSDIENGRFCCHPPFQVKGQGQSRLIIVFPAFLLARSSPLEDRRCRFGSFCPSTGHGRRRWRSAGAVWPFRVEANSLHLELRHREWTFLLPPFVPGERSGSEPSNHCFPGFPSGTVVAARGSPVPFGRSRWKQIASTWNSDIENGRFCCHPPFQVKGRGQSRLIIAFHASHLARSSQLGDRRCRLAVPGGGKLLPPGTPTSGMDVSVAALRSR